MKNIQLSALLFLLSAFSIKAQSFSINWVDGEKQAAEYSDVVVLKNGNYLLLKLPHGKVGFGGRDLTGNPSFVLADAQMQPIKEEVFEISEKGDAGRELRKVGGEVFLTYRTREKGQTIVYAIKIDQQTLKGSEKKILASIEGEQFAFAPEIKVCLSPDSSHVLLYVEGFGSKKENKQVFLGVFDKGLNRVWSRYQELPIGNRSAAIEDYAVSDQGKVYLAVRHYEKDPSNYRFVNRGSKVPPYQYKLFVYSKSGPPQQISVVSGEHFITGTKLLFEKNGLVRLAGLYSKSPNGYIPGAFYTSFDSSASIIRVNDLLPFPETIIAAVANDDQGKSKGSDIGISSWLRIKHILARQNGTIDIVSEVQKETENFEQSKDGGFNGQTHYSYEYGNIINLSITKGTSTTFTRIPKMQETSYTTRGLGYFPTFYGNKLVLLYNDVAENLNRDISESPKGYSTSKRNAVLVAAVIDEKGNLTRKPVYNFREEKKVTLPLFFDYLSGGKIFLVSAWGGVFSAPRLSFGLLEIK